MDLELSQILELDLKLNAMGITGIHHTHIGGEWMVGYKFMSMHMDGNRDGTDRMSETEVLSQFMVTPTEMDMEMHMLDLMWAPNDDWTYMVMVPFLRQSMKHLNMAGTRFETESQGIGDLKLAGLYSIWRRDREDRTQRFVLQAGLSVPTGSINVKDRTPMGRLTLPYAMQLGSGTVDLQPGLTYLAQRHRWAWGAHLSSVLRVDTNEEHYQLGNEVLLDLWVSKKWTNWLSTSLRVQGRGWGNIHGADSRLNPAMVPTADPHLRAGQRVDVLLGANLFALAGSLEGHRVAIEAGFPIYQNLQGPQLETDWRVTLGWNYTFRP